METKTREAQIEADIYAQVQRRFAEFDDPAHGWEHIKRVYQLALHIAEAENADRFIAGTAALLHDIGRLTHDTTQHHAEISKSLASELLSAYPITHEQKEAILHAIIAHSYRHLTLGDNRDHPAYSSNSVIPPGRSFRGTASTR